MKFLDENFLLESFHEEGTKREDFEMLVKCIDQHTSHKERVLKNFTLISVFDETKQTDREYIRGYYISAAEPISDGRLKTCSIKKQIFRGQGNFDRLIEEAVQSRSMLLKDEQTDMVYFFSDQAMKTLAQRIKMESAPISDHSVERDIFLASKMDVDLEVTLVIKQYRQIGKVFAVMSDKYQPIPLYTICELYSKLMKDNPLGAMKCRSWKISHDHIRITFSFDDYAQVIRNSFGLDEEIIPCVTFMTSDIGECSTRVQGFWKLGSGGIVYGKTCSKVHKGELNIDEFDDKVRNEVFSTFIELPEHLLELMGIDVSPEEDLSTSHGRARNRKAVLQMYRDIINKTEASEAIGKSRTKELMRYIDYSVINENRIYSAFDIVRDLLSLAEGFRKDLKNKKDKNVMGDECFEKFQRCLSKAPSLKF